MGSTTQAISPTGRSPTWNKEDVFWLPIVEVVSYSLIFVLGTIGNGLVVFITGFQMKKTVNSVWILNLAIADFTFSFFLLFNIVHASLEFHWPFGRILCKLRHAVILLNLCASIYLLVIISIDRCVSVWCPVWSRNHRTPRLASFVVLGVWILALVFCSPQLYSKETYNNLQTNKTECKNNYGKSTEGRESIRGVMSLLKFMFAFFIPFTVILLCYGAIVVRLWRSRLSQTSRAFKVITVVIVAFFVCWLPYHLFSFLKGAKSSDELPKVEFIGYRLSHSLAYFNSCLNPILYFCMGSNFKEKLRCSFLSAFNSAFTEDSNHNATKIGTESTDVMVLHNL